MKIEKKRPAKFLEKIYKMNDDELRNRQENCKAFFLHSEILKKL